VEEVHGAPTWSWAETVLKRVAPTKRAIDEERILTYYCRASECRASVNERKKRRREEKTLLDAGIKGGILLSLYLTQGMTIS
jgi:hypothetical protein